jgi:hypothetical protein
MGALSVSDMRMLNDEDVVRLFRSEVKRAFSAVDRPGLRGAFAMFRWGLGETGYVEGRNAKIERDYLIRDRDRVYGAAVIHRWRAMGIRDKPIAPGSPWQNGFAERLIGSIRRECVDHIVVLGEAHLRRILTKYAAYYNELRTHRSLGKDAPIHRAIQHVGRIAVSSADFIIIIAESNFRYRQLHEQPDNCKGHAGSNARINVQCSEFVMQLARSVRRACLGGCARGP